MCKVLLFIVRVLVNVARLEIFGAKVNRPFNVLAAHFGAVAVIKRLLEIGAESFASLHIEHMFFKKNIHR